MRRMQPEWRTPILRMRNFGFQVWAIAQHFDISERDVLDVIHADRLRRQQLQRERNREQWKEHFLRIASGASS